MGDRTYFWTGQALNADGSVFNAASGGGSAGGHTGNFWNYHGNWKVYINGPTSGTSGPYGVHFIDPEVNEFPTNGSQVHFSYLPDLAEIGLSGGPFPKAPCLFGGCYGDPETGLTWGGVTAPTNDAAAGTSGDIRNVYVNTGYHNHLGAVSGDYIYSMGGEGTSSERYSGMRGYDSLRIRTGSMKVMTADQELYWTHGAVDGQPEAQMNHHWHMMQPAPLMPEAFKTARTNITKLRNSSFAFGLHVLGNSYFEIEDSNVNFLRNYRTWFKTPVEQDSATGGAITTARNDCSPPTSPGITRVKGCTIDSGLQIGMPSESDSQGNDRFNPLKGATFTWCPSLTSISGYGSSGAGNAQIGYVNIFQPRSNTADNGRGLISLDCDIANMNLYPETYLENVHNVNGHGYFQPVSMNSAGTARHTIGTCKWHASNDTSSGGTHNNTLEIDCGCTIDNANIVAGKLTLGEFLDSNAKVCVTDGFLHQRSLVDGTHPTIGAEYTGFAIGSNQGNTVEGFNIVDSGAQIKFPEGIYVLADYSYGSTSAFLSSQRKGG